MHIKTNFNNKKKRRNDLRMKKWMEQMQCLKDNHQIHKEFKKNNK